MKILSAAQFYEADKVTVTKNKMTSADLMERAATVCFQWIHSRLNGNNIPIKVFCGTGNNGGDGLVIARHLKQHGYNVSTYVVNCSNIRTQDFLTNYERLKELGVWPEVITCTTELPVLSENDMIVDAIFGLGLTRPPTDVIKEVIQHINAVNAYVLSIDFPSGLYADKSIEDKDAVIKSFQTLTFQSPKLAFMLPENQDYINLWEVVDIGLDAEFMNNVVVENHIIGKENAQLFYKYRKKFSYKGDYGHSLLIGGSFGKIGAVSLASKAALTIGSGKVTAYIPNCGYQILQTALPEVMVEVDTEKEITQFKSKVDATVIGIGMGLGTSAKTAAGFAQFLSANKKPLVIDADGINLLAKNKDLLKLIPENSVLTPHPKEFERLVGKCKNDFDRLTKLKKLAVKHKLVVVLKGAYTAIAHQGVTYFNATGNPALATAGSGDVLTGIITGLIAQGYSPFEASILGVYLHGKTAELAMTNLVYETFNASDSIDYLSDAYKDLLTQELPTTEQQEEVPNQELDTENNTMHL
tara:strand:+ start:93662 stop:95242 length:1581 start_codon:yes stop_codon:yes gene_type:complete